MTAEKLFETLQFMSQLDAQLRIQATLNTIRDMLNNLVSQPANPQFQTSLGAALGELAASATKLATAIAPFQAAVIGEMGGEEFFSPLMAQRIQDKVSANAITPSVARDYVNDFVNRRTSFVDTVQKTLQGLQSLNLQPRRHAGEADILFLIPYELFDKGVGNFAKELTFINRLMEHINEAVSGEVRPAILTGLSSSTPTISVEAALNVVSSIAAIVQKFLDTWERVRKFRRVRDELTEMGMKGAAVDELTDQVTNIIEETVEQSTSIVIAHYPTNGNSARKNELTNALRTEITRLYGQIERGLAVDFRVDEASKSDKADQEAVRNIADIANALRFPDPARDPLLLEPGEVLEGEIHLRKVTTKTTTTQRKTPKPPPNK